ncbi:methyltransferase domain-containing protein [Sphingobium sufflavum]|uniref:methyltransferase domain-containing protein n=1 Tax=Sphingobium sufflavum TaxID=1129547 RepID=UPI001F16E3D9|nr:methyltransferase domain-containing protein [Sphingobium sufflavum]MCE7796557.1 methyltransferase domain-containing protein [Sphingobium sufflavum]
MPDLRIRSAEPEWMDGDEVSEAEFAACLHDLAKVNSVTLARPPTLRFIAQAFARAAGRPLTLLDVGYGAGDMLRAISRYAKRRQTDIRLIGIDLNPRSLPSARAATPDSMAIDYRTGDIFALSEDEPIDLVISSLVTHHMSDAEILCFIRWIDRRARCGWFINDLHRHPVAYHGFRALSAAMRWHPFVRHDGPLSVARSFRRADWDRLLCAAGVEGVARVAWHVPFRLCVTRWRE